MEIFTGDYTVIKDDIETLLESIYHPSNKLEKMNTFSLLYLLINEYGRYDSAAAFKYLRALNKNRSFVLNQINVAQQLGMKNFESLMINKDLHKEICSSVMNPDEEILCEDFENSLETGILLDENTKYEIFTDFLRENHPNMLEYFDKLIMEKHLFINDMSEDIDTKYYTNGGVNVVNPIDEKFYIFIQESKSDIITLDSLAHEIGHVADYLELFSHTNKKQQVYYAHKSILIEVISSLYEKEFIDFAIKYHLDTKHVLNRLQDYYLNIFYHFNEMNLLYNFPENILRNDRYASIPKEKLYSIAVENCDVLVDYEDFPEPDELNLSYNLEYGYGKLFATYFSYLKKHDINKYKESMYEFLKIRNDEFSIDLFTRLHVTPKQMIQAIKSEINSSDAKIKIKMQ